MAVVVRASLRTCLVPRLTAAGARQLSTVEEDLSQVSLTGS